LGDEWRVLKREPLWGIDDEKIIDLFVVADKLYHIIASYWSCQILLHCINKKEKLQSFLLGKISL
jgi:hypothetical protein